jgi:hypothetical protein
MNLIISIFIFIILLYFSFFFYETFQTTTSTNIRTYFELSDSDKELIDNTENDSKLSELLVEEQQMQNRVRKIINESKDVISNAKLDQSYFKEINFDSGMKSDNK